MKERLGTEPALRPTHKTGQFDVVVDGKIVASRGAIPLTRVLFGAGFPDPVALVDDLANQRG